MAQNKEGELSSQLSDIWMALVLPQFDAETSKIHEYSETLKLVYLAAETTTIQKKYRDQELFGVLTSYLITGFVH